LGDVEAMNKDDDLPEWSDDLVPKAVLAQDLHLGAATVKPLSRSWMEEHGPQPPGPGLRMLDYMILAMFAGSVLLFIKACYWAVFS
jgi:hypothetical protein